MRLISKNAFYVLFLFAYILILALNPSSVQAPTEQAPAPAVLSSGS